MTRTAVPTQTRTMQLIQPASGAVQRGPDLAVGPYDVVEVFTPTAAATVFVAIDNPGVNGTNGPWAASLQQATFPQQLSVQNVNQIYSFSTTTGAVTTIRMRVSGVL